MLARSLQDPGRLQKRGGLVGRFSWFLVIAVLSSAAVTTGTGLPSEVAGRFESVVSLADADDFVGSYRMTLSSVVQKLNGKSRKENLIEAEVVNHNDGASRRRLLKFIEDGADVTEKKRTKFEGEEGGNQDGDGDEDDDTDLANPFGDTADHYRFGAPETRGSTVVITFEPAPGYEDDENIARGLIAWDGESLEPRWLEMEALHPPKPLKELRVRLEFDRIDGEVFMSRLVTDGLAKVLLLTREFHMDLRFDDIRPASKNDVSSD
jgi:hypothetical protein